jgi:beta-lactamase regulating signal transducer with metallopeptidase domain
MNGEAVWHWAETLGTWAWRASWQGAALAAIVALALWLAGRRVAPAWRFGLWGLVLMRLAMPALVAWEWKHPPEVKGSAVRAPEPHPVVVTSSGLSDLPVMRHAVTPVKREIKPAAVYRAPVVNRVSPMLRYVEQGRRYLIALWLAGMALLGMRVAWSSLRLGRAVRRMIVIEDGRVRDLLRECCDRLGIRRAPELRQLPGAGAPALLGFWRPKVLLPAQVLMRLGEDELRLILMHELAHLKRCDVLVNWLATLVAVLHWFNPAAWLVVWRMRVEREMACDEMVLREERGEAYGRTIVRLAEVLSAGGWSGPVARVASSVGAVGILEGRAQLQRRLLMIARYDAKRRRGPVMAMGLAMVIGAAALSGVTRADDDRAKPPTNDKPKATVEKGAPFAPATPRAGGLPGSAGAPARPKAFAAGANPAAVMGGYPGALPGAAKLSPEEEKANARTAELLKRPIADIKFNDVALADVADYLRDITKVDILVEWPALEQMGVTRDAPVTLRLHEPTPADAVLTLMFRGMGDGLRYEIDKGVVVIGPSSKRAAVVVRVYDVGDLLSTNAFAGAPASPGPVDPGVGPRWGAESADAAQLTRLIMATVGPDTWQDNGGAGTMTVFKNKLVVKASEPEQKEILSLLELLRDKPETHERTTGRPAHPKVEQAEPRTP